MKRAVRSSSIKCLKLPVTADNHVYVLLYRYSSLHGQVVYDAHFTLELGIVLHGVIERRWSQRKKRLKPGEMWLCGIWEPHGYSVVTAPCEAVIFVIRPALLAEMICPEAPHFDWLAPFVVGGKDRPQIPDSLCSSSIALGKRIAALVRNENHHARPNGALADSADKTSGNEDHIKLKLRAYLMETLLMLTEQWTPPLERSIQPAPVYARVNSVVGWVFHQRRFVSADEAAHVCNMPRDAFCRAFQSVMGITFADFVLNYRLNGARDQMLTTSDPIKKIARDWGFVDHSHFHHAFIRHYGRKPASYKKIWLNPAFHGTLALV